MDVSKLSDNDLIFEYGYVSRLSSWNSGEDRLGKEIGDEMVRRGLDFGSRQNIMQQLKPKTRWMRIVEFIISRFRH
jgi:hypothetical protein